MKFSSKLLDGPDDMSAFFTHMVELGLTDGLPVIPPTVEAVEAMIGHVGLPPEQEIAVIPPEDGIATIEKLAVNSVMAGCLPEYFPVVIAAVKALAEKAFNLLAVQTTTNPVSPMLLINGPIRNQIGIACGRGCLGNGFRANATIGRAVKLALRNIGACTPGDVSKSTHGFPGRFTFCFGELEEESPWIPFHVERGFAITDSAVSVFGSQGTQNMYASFVNAEGLIHMIADGMRCYGNNGYLRCTGVPVVILSPGHAKVFANDGWDKARIREELFARTPIALAQVSPEKQVAHPIYEDRDRSGSINLCKSPDNIVIVVAGGAEPYHLTYVPSFSTPDEIIIKPIEIPKAH